MLQGFLGIVLLAATLSPLSQAALNDRLHQILAEVAAQPRASAAPSVVTLATPTSSAASVCSRTIKASRWLRYGAQIANALVVGNAVRRGSKGRILWSASPVGYISEYALIDFGADAIDRRMQCDVRAKINAIFGLGALYNAAQTEFPR